MKRINGQIWIDREDPHNLKYHLDGVDYVVQSLSDYLIVDDETTIEMGMVVRDADKPNTIMPATFPQDIDRILGIALNSSKSDMPNDTAAHISVAQSGTLILENEEISSVFALESDLNISTNGWLEENKGIGCPVYWFIGITKKDGDSYTYTDSTSHPGKITFSTPSGYKYPNTIEIDSSLNVSYDNLPRIGTVVGYEVDDDGKLTSLTININFATFDSSLEWNWPGEHFDDQCGLINPTAENTLTIRHGLFADNPQNLQVINYSNIVADDDGKSGSIYNMQTRAVNYTSGEDRRTVFDIHTPNPYYYRVSGEVHYNFDRNHPSGE